MRVSHSFPAISTVFDDPNLVSCAGLAPTMALAQRAGLADLVSSTLTLKAIGGVNAHLKVPALVAGMVAGADSIDDMDLLRHGGMGRLFTGIRAPPRWALSCARSPLAIMPISGLCRVGGALAAFALFRGEAADDEVGIIRVTRGRPATGLAAGSVRGGRRLALCVPGRVL
jgi:hypothetical protein